MTDDFQAKVDAAISAINPKPSKLYSRTRTRAEASKANKLARRLAGAMPADVRRYYVEKYNGVAEDAFLRLLTGSDHACDKCRCHIPNHQAVRTFMEMAGAVGAQTQVFVSLAAK